MLKATNKNLRLRIKNVCELTQKYYEAGNHAKCYKAVFLKHVYPVYPMCYRTYLNYINYSPVRDTRQLSLFN